jgi:N-acetylglutamate synthase-like GNAT family acetyltransferase
MNPLITEANALLKNGGFDYAFCGGCAIELFLNETVRKHGDIDVSTFWRDRDKVILFMQSLGWNVYEMCGGGLAHRVTDIADQIKAKRNIFCFKDGCELVAPSPTNEPNMFTLEFDHSGQSTLNFIEFLFNDCDGDNFLYARNMEIALPLSKAVLRHDDIPHLAPELVLLYKSSDIEREGYQKDFDSAFFKMSVEQKGWFVGALRTMFPNGHKWNSPLCTATFSDREITKSELGAIYEDFKRIDAQNGIPLSPQVRYQFIAEQDGRVIGFASGLTNHKWFYLSDMWVAANYRRQGLGARLLRMLGEKARSVGIEHVYTWTSGVGNAAFYEKRRILSICRF